MNRQPKEPKKINKICGWCGQPFEAERERARWCSDRCKMQAARARWGKAENVTVSPLVEDRNP